MPYDQLGNFIYDEELPSTPSVDTMKLALTKHKPTFYETLKNTTAQMNPMLLPLYMRDMGRIGTNMAAPLVGAAAGTLGNIQAQGAQALHNAVGDTASAQEAANRVVRPDAPEQAAKFTVPYQTPAGQATAEGLGQALDTLHLPAGGPGSGLPGHAPVSPRPLMTPNDLRVLGAEATRVGRQVGDIPQDFRNAQSGVQRIDPITGQPTMGVKLQGAADRVGDIIAQRQMQGLPPVPGIPAALQPQTRMYAMRPEKSTLIRPEIPATAEGYDLHDPFKEVYNDVVEYQQPLTALDTRKLMRSKVTKEPGRSTPRDVAEAHRLYEEGVDNLKKAEIARMFPTAPSERDARQAYEARFYNQEARAAENLRLHDEFLKTPEGQTLNARLNYPTSEVAVARHEAAKDWLNTHFKNYYTRQHGASNEKLAKLASEGFTMYDPDKLHSMFNEINTSDVQHRRARAGMPPTTIIEHTFNEEVNKLFELNREHAKAEAEKNEQQRIAQSTPGLTRSADYPPFLEASRKVAQLDNKREQLQKKVDNLNLGRIYEYLADAGINVHTADEYARARSFNEIENFYPGIKRMQEKGLGGENVYTSDNASVRRTGLSKVAQQFYDDALAGHIPLENIPKTPIENYIKKHAAERIEQERNNKVKEQQFKANAEARLKAVAAKIPNDKTFEGAGVLELDSRMPIDELNRHMSDTTAVLDHCIGKGGSAPSTAKFHWFKDGEAKGHSVTYAPIYDIATGERNPAATYDTSEYAQRAANDVEKYADFRDLQTGLPFFTIQLSPAGTGATGNRLYHMGWASGFKNGNTPMPQNRPAIRDYLNSISDELIPLSGKELPSHADIYDLTSDQHRNLLESRLNMKRRDLDKQDLNGLNRFVMPEDVRAAIGQQQANKPAAPAFRTAPVPHADIVEDLRLAAQNAVHDTQTNNTMDPEDAVHLTRQVASYIQDAVDSLGDRAAYEQNPVGRLGAVRENIERQINALRSRGMVSASEIADGLDTFLVDLNGITGNVERLLQQQPQQLRNHQGNPFDVDRAVQQFGIPPDLAERIATQLVEAENTARTPLDAHQSLEDLMTTAQLRQGTVFGNLTDPEHQGALYMMRTAIRQFEETGSALTPETGFDRPALDFEVDETHPANQPQRANLPAEVQQNINQRNYHLTNAYQTALTPNTGNGSVDTALSEFSDLLNDMATNLFGNGYNTSEIAENLAARVHAEHMSLVTPDRIDARGLTPNEADMIRQRLNNAYGNLRMIQEMGAPVEQQRQGFTPQDALDMARDLLEQERINGQGNRVHVPSVEDSIHALREDMFDDPRITQLPEHLRSPFRQSVSNALETLLNTLGADERLPRPQQPVADNVFGITGQALPQRQSARSVMYEMLDTVRGEYTPQIANHIEQVVHRISVSVPPEQNPEAFIRALRDAAQAEPTQHGEQIIRNISDHLEQRLQRNPPEGHKRGGHIRKFGDGGKAEKEPPSTAPFSLTASNVFPQNPNALPNTAPPPADMIMGRVGHNIHGQHGTLALGATGRSMGTPEGRINKLAGVDVTYEHPSGAYARMNRIIDNPAFTKYEIGYRKAFANGGQSVKPAAPKPAPTPDTIDINELLEESLLDRLGNSVQPMINGGLDAMFPSRKLIRNAIVEGGFRPLAREVQRDPYRAADQQEQYDRRVNEAKRLMGNEVRKPFGIAPVPEPAFDPSRALGDVNINEFPNPNNPLDPMKELRERMLRYISEVPRRAEGGGVKSNPTYNADQMRYALLRNK